jgi:hypothetical protein
LIPDRIGVHGEASRTGALQLRDRPDPAAIRAWTSQIAIYRSKDAESAEQYLIPLMRDGEALIAGEQQNAPAWPRYALLRGSSDDEEAWGS